MLSLLAVAEQNSLNKSLYFDFFLVFVFATVGVLFVIFNVAIVNRLLRPKVPDPKKFETYECGEVPISDSWVHFDIRFYTIALVFLIFDVEIAFLYPWAVVFRNLCGSEASISGAFVLLEMLFFLLVLVVGLIYVWAKGDLDWVTYTLRQQKEQK